MKTFLWKSSVGVLTIMCLINIFTKCCNESVCGSIVSKCLLMQLCTCSPGNYTCNKECYYCLKDFYSECCSCVDLCELPDPYQIEEIDSYVGVIDHPVPGLFQALADEESDWTTETFQIRFHLSKPEVPKMTAIQMNSNIHEVLQNDKASLMECTAVFWNNCTSVSKCEKICASMGASGFRWFHDGCCECVGETCFNFGLKESRCRQCSYGIEADWDTEEDIYHYSEDDDEDDMINVIDSTW